MPKNNKIVTFIFNAAIFILMEIAALNMLSHNGQLQNIWLAHGAHKFQADVWGWTEGVKYYFSLNKENQKLADENFELREALMKYKAKEERMKVDTMKIDLDSLPQVNGFEYLNADIVKMSKNKQHNYIIIGKGSDDGVCPKSGIITGHGVVGIIDAVGKHYSYALSFMNSDVSISARLGNEGAVGPLEWDGVSSNGAVLKEIPLQFKFQPGDTVYTSGYSSIFPPDIPLGVTKDSHIVNGATNEIRVTLFQEYKALRYVTIVNNVGKTEIESMENKEDNNNTTKK